MSPRLWLVAIAVLFLAGAQMPESAAQSSPASASGQPDTQPPNAVPVAASASTAPASAAPATMDQVVFSCGSTPWLIEEVLLLRMHHRVLCHGGRVAICLI